MKLTPAYSFTHLFVSVCVCVWESACVKKSVRKRGKERDSKVWKSDEESEMEKSVRKSDGGEGGDGERLRSEGC